MAKKKFHIVNITGGPSGEFSSARQAFQFCADNKLCPGSNFGWKQGQELIRLHAEGKILYTTEWKESQSVAAGGDIRTMIRDEVRKVFAIMPPREIALTFNGKKRIIDGLNHYEFEKVLKCFAAKTNVMLVGPSGSGKTTCAHKAADALSLDFYSMPVGIQTSKVEFMGYMDATGKYIPTLFRKAYEEGGIFLIDEIDAGNAGVLTVVNAALANGMCPFPDKMVKKHANFLCCAAANTWGKGADRQYVGRNQLDAATLNRFVKMTFDYDEVLEEKLATIKPWFDLVKKLRKIVFDKKLRVLVTPRATFDGCALLEQGMNYWEVLELTIFNGCSEEETNTIMNAAGIAKDNLQKKKA